MSTSASAVSHAGRRVFHNTALVGAGTGVRMVLGFFTTILVTDNLGIQYGLLTGAQNYVDFFKILVLFGLNTVMVRELASGREERGLLLGSVLLLRALFAILFVAVTLASAALSGYLPEHRELLWIFTAAALAFVFVETMRGFCDGFNKMGRTAPLLVTRSVFTLAGAAGVVWCGGGLLAQALVLLGVQLLQVPVSLYLARGLLRGVRLGASAARMGRLLREAPHYMAVGFAWGAMRSLSVMALTRFSTPEETSMFSAAFNFIDLLLMLPLLAQRAFLPVFSREGRDVREIARQGIQVFTAVLMPAALGLALLAESAVALYPSGEFAAAAPVLRVQALGLLFTCTTAVGITFLTGQGRVRQILFAYAAALPVKAVLCALLARSHGALGVAWGTVAAQGVLCAVVHLGTRSCGLRLPWAALLRHLAAAAIMCAAVAPLRELFFPVPMAAGAAVYAAALLAICPSESLERRLAAQLVARVRSH